MKKNVRNALAISGLALAMGASAFTMEASANMKGNARVQRSHQERIMRTKKIKTEKVVHSRRFAVGFVKNVDKKNNTLTVTQGSKTFTVTVIPDTTRILDRKWKDLTLTKIEVGNKVKVSGTITDLTITAKMIRDISLL